MGKYGDTVRTPAERKAIVLSHVTIIPSIKKRWLN